MENIHVYSLCLLVSFSIASKTTMAQDDIAPVWNDDGSHIYFYSYRGVTPSQAYDQPAQSYYMKRDGSDQTKITNSQHNHWWTMPYHHSQLIVVSDRDANKPFEGANIYIHDPEKNTYSALSSVDPKKGEWALWMSKSYNNKHITYLLPDNPFNVKTSKLFIMDLEAKTQKQLLQHFHSIQYPYLSGNGKKIAFVSDNSIYLADANGENSKKILTMPQTEESKFYGLSLSFEGDFIAFSFAKNGIESAEIFTIQSDGKKLIQLTKNKFRDTNPSLSPDGKSIAFNSVRNNDLNHNDIYLIPSTGNHVEINLTKTSDLLPKE